MPNDRRYERPNKGDAYIYDRGKNAPRYRKEAHDKKPLSAETLDMEFNYFVYALNEINKGKNPLNPPIDSHGKLVWIGHDSKEIRYDKLGEHHIQDHGLDADILVKDKSINNDKLADDSVDTDNIVNTAVTTDKIRDLNVTNAKLANDSVTTDKIRDLNVTKEKIAQHAVTGDKIAPNSIRDVHVHDVDGGKIKDETIRGGENHPNVKGTIAPNTITGYNIKNASVPFDKMTGEVDTDHIKDGAITDKKIESVSGGKVTGEVKKATISGISTYTNGFTPVAAQAINSLVEKKTSKYKILLTFMWSSKPGGKQKRLIRWGSIINVNALSGHDHYIDGNTPAQKECYNTYWFDA